LLSSAIAVTLVAALGLLAVALTGNELTLEAAVHSCVQSGGTILAIGIFALLAGFVVAFTGLPVRRGSNGPKSLR
jgi:hypothetical protein